MGADVCTFHSERVAAGYPACCERPGKPAVPTTAERGGEPPPGRARYSPDREAQRLAVQFGWNRGAFTASPRSFVIRGEAFFIFRSFLIRKGSIYEDHL